MNSYDEIIEMLNQVDIIEETCVELVGDDIWIPIHKEYSANEHFCRWKSEVLYALESFSRKPIVVETVKMLNEFPSGAFNEDDCFIRLKGNIKTIIAHLDDLVDKTSVTQKDFSKYGDLAELFEKANIAYQANLGAGALVYLRKIFESVAMETADAVKISYEKYESGNPKNFRLLLQQVDKSYGIIPSEFSANGYKLYQELSNIVHGDLKEDEGIKKFTALQRLIIGIVENVQNKEEFREALKTLGWDKGQEDYE